MFFPVRQDLADAAGVARAAIPSHQEIGNSIHVAVATCVVTAVLLNVAFKVEYGEVVGATLTCKRGKEGEQPSTKSTPKSNPKQTLIVKDKKPKLLRKDIGKLPCGITVNMTKQEFVVDSRLEGVECSETLKWDDDNWEEVLKAATDWQTLCAKASEAHQSQTQAILKDLCKEVGCKSTGTKAEMAGRLVVELDQLKPVLPKKDKEQPKKGKSQEQVILDAMISDQKPPAAGKEITHLVLRRNSEEEGKDKPEKVVQEVTEKDFPISLAGRSFIELISAMRSRSEGVTYGVYVGTKSKAPKDKTVARMLHTVTYLFPQIVAKQEPDWKEFNFENLEVAPGTQTHTIIYIYIYINKSS
jgi:hypothetical protein